MFATNHYKQMYPKPDEMDTTECPRQAHKVRINSSQGTNIVNTISDPQAFADDFIKYYLNDILKNKDYSMINEYTEFKYNKYIYKNTELVTLLEEMGRKSITIKCMEVLASGSRRFDINIIGTFEGSTISQHFLLNNEKGNNWKIKSSIICVI